MQPHLACPIVQGEFIWIWGWGKDPVALRGLDTMDERRRAGRPLAGMISAYGPLVRAWISCSLASLAFPSSSVLQQRMGRPESLLFHPSLQRCHLGFAAGPLQFVESNCQVSQDRQRLGCLAVLHPAQVLLEAHISPVVHSVLNA